MVNHKKRVQRKIKRDVKRKVAAARAKQNANAAADKNMEMIKTMMLMMNGGNKTPGLDPNDAITAKEIALQKKNEEARKKIEDKNKIKQMEEEFEAYKTKAENERVETRRKHLEELNKAKMKNVEEKNKTKRVQDDFEIDKLTAQSKMEAANRKYLEKKLGLQRDIEGLSSKQLEQKQKNELLKQQLELQKLEKDKKEKELDIENLTNERGRLEKDVSEMYSKVKNLLKLTGRSASAYKDVLNDIESFKDLLQTNIIDKLLEINEKQQRIKSSTGNDTKLLNVKKANTALNVALRELNDKLEQWDNVDKKLKEEKIENQNLKIEVAATKKALEIQTLVKRVDDENNVLYGVLETKPKDPEHPKIARWVKEEELDSIPEELKARKYSYKNLTDTQASNKTLETTIKQQNAKLKRVEDMILESDAATDKANVLQAEIDANNKIGYKYDELVQRRGAAEAKLSELREKLKENQLSRADYTKYEREVAALERKVQELDAEIAQTPSKPVSAIQIQRRATLEKQIDDKEHKLNLNKTSQDFNKQLEIENAKSEMENKVLQGKVNAANSKDTEKKLQNAINTGVEIDEERKALEEEKKAKEAQKELEMMQFRENAANAPKVKASRDKAKEAMKLIAITEQQREAEVEKLNAMKAAQKTKAKVEQTRAVQNYVMNDGTVDTSGAFAALNQVLNEQEARDEAKRNEYQQNRQSIRKLIHGDMSIVPVYNALVEGRFQGITSEADVDELLSDTVKQGAFISLSNRLRNDIRTYGDIDEAMKTWSANPDIDEALSRIYHEDEDKNNDDDFMN